MVNTPLAAALLAAHKERATGWLTLSAHGRTTKLALREGRVVDAEWGLGHHGVGAALLARGRIDAATLDVLWARGEAGKPDQETLLELGLLPSEAAKAQVLEGVRGLAA